jgi:hypothetical protein
MRRAHLSLPIALVIVLAAANVRGQVVDASAQIPEPLRVHLRTERFTPVASVSALPANVRKALQELFGEATLEMAEPGAPFQQTDLVQTPRLPWRRLVSAGCAEDHCLVYYEKGGYVRVFYALVFHMGEKGAALEFGGTAPGGPSDLEALKAAVISGKVVGQTKTKYW